MKAITTLLLVSILITAHAQEIPPPSEGKAVVYFVRTSSMGFAINFSYFHNDQFIGKFNGPKYMRYECDPGEHIFWARSENRDYISADLEAGKIYFIEAIPTMGGLKAQVILDPVLPTDAKRIAKIKKLMAKKPSESFTAAELGPENERLKDVIASGLERYQEKLGEGNIGYLKKDMFHPIQ